MTLTLGTPTTATGLDANSSPHLPNYNMLVPCGTDRAVYVYYNNTLNQWEARACSTSGMSITGIGSAVVMLDSTEANNLGNGLIFPFELSATHFGIAWLESTGFPNCRIRVRISSVSGTTITPGAAGTIATLTAFVAVNSLNASRITDTRACCVWRDPLGTNDGHAAAFDITGTTVGTPGSTIAWSSGTTPSYIYADSLRDDQHVIVGSRHSGAWAVVLDNTGGTTLVAGTEVQVSSATNAVFTMVLGMSATRAQYAYAHNTNSPDWRGRARQLDISGTTITLAGSAAFWGGTNGQNDLPGWTRMDATHGIMNIHNNSLTQIEEAAESQNNGTMGVGSGLTLISPSVRDNMGIAFVGGNRAAVIYDTNQIAVISTDLIPTTNSFRFLGLAADTEQLYIAGLKDGATLQLYTYSDLDTLTEDGTIHAFGAATDSDIDSLAKGIFPVTRPGADKIVYLFGRDGSDIQVQQNDLNGAGGWQDIGAGSPTWAATKMCIALLPDILDPDDLIAAFGDDDVYRSQDDGGAWVKMGDAPTTLRGGARHPITDNELLLAGTASGDPHYSHNFGVSFAGATDDDIIQTEEVRIAAGADDGWVDQGLPNFYDSLVNVSMGQISGNDADAWFRFQDVQTPNGATITAAHIEFVASNSGSGAVTLDVFGEDADNPAAPSSAADYNARTRTTATINWDPGDWTAEEIYLTDDIKTIIQEIVDRAGWATGNAMQIFIERSTGIVRRLARSYEGSTTQAALLHVEYQVTGLINAIEYSL